MAQQDDLKNIPLRLTIDEHQTVKMAAVLAGKPNMHQYVRDLVLADARRVLREKGLPVPGEGTARE